MSHQGGPTLNLKMYDHDGFHVAGYLEKYEVQYKSAKGTGSLLCFLKMFLVLTA